MKIKQLNIVSILAAVLVILSCVSPKSESDFSDEKTYASVTIHMKDQNQQKNSNSARLAAISTLPSDSKTVLVIAVAASENITTAYNSINNNNVHSRGILNLTTSAVSLQVPLNTPFKLFEYTFSKPYTLSELLSTNRMVVSYSEIPAFTITNSTTEINVQSNLQLATAPVSIALTPSTSEISKGETLQYAATATYADGTQQNLTNLLSWVSSNTASTTITNSTESKGLATAVADGTTTITATGAGITGSTTLKVGSTPTFVTIQGNLVDDKNAPIGYATISNSLDNSHTQTDANGNFTLTTTVTSVSAPYFIYAEWCESISYQTSGTNPTGIQIKMSCGYNEDLNVDPSKHVVGGVVSQNSTETWYYHSISKPILTWNKFNSLGPLSVYFLSDDTNGLDETNSTTLANNVNNKDWRKKIENVLNTTASGSITVDPSKIDEGHSYDMRLLVIDQNGYWDINDYNFQMALVDPNRYATGGLITPNGGETWQFGTNATITWNTSLLNSTGDVSFFMLNESETADLNTPLAIDLANAVNSKKWNSDEDSTPNTGYWEGNPQFIGANGANSRLLIIDKDGNWDLSDANFTINMVENSKYAPTAMLSPNGGEVWPENSSQTITWNTSNITGDMVSIYMLRDSPVNLDVTDPIQLTNAVNSKKWEHRHYDENNTGSTIKDSEIFSDNANNSRLLILDENGNWDITDSNFTVEGGKYGTPTDLSAVTPDFTSDMFCENAGGCTSLDQVVLHSMPGNQWFVQTQIFGTEYTVQLVPTDLNYPSSMNGKVYGRPLDSNNNAISGEPYREIGLYTPTTANSNSALIVTAGNDLSIVIWVEGGTLKQAEYIPPYNTTNVTGSILTGSDELYVFFNQEMDTTKGAVSGLSVPPSSAWSYDDNTYHIILGSPYVDGEKLTLYYTDFAKYDGIQMTYDWEYPIKHFVTIGGMVVDENSNPYQYSLVMSSLDEVEGSTDPNGAFTLATTSNNPGQEYFLYVSAGSETIGYDVSGQNPSGTQYIHQQGPISAPTVTVASGNYQDGGVMSQNIAETWFYHTPATINWDISKFTGSYLSIYILRDTTTGLDESDPVLLASNVNSKVWYKRFHDISPTIHSSSGSIVINPEIFQDAGAGTFRILIVDDIGNWDINNVDFNIHLVEESYFQSFAISAPNSGGEIWNSGVHESIIWDHYSFQGSISLYVLADSSTGLSGTTTEITTAVNSKNWRNVYRRIGNTGEFKLDPQMISGNGTQSRILMIDQNGSWDICDVDFTINP